MFLITELRYFIDNYELSRGALSLSFAIAASRQWMRLGREIPEAIIIRDTLLTGRVTKDTKLMCKFLLATSNFFYYLFDHASFLAAAGVYFTNTTCDLFD